MSYVSLERNILGDEVQYGRDLLRSGNLHLRRLSLPPGGLLIAGVPQFDENMDLHLKDNDKIFFGNDDDSSFTFNGTHLILTLPLLGDLWINQDGTTAQRGLAFGAGDGFGNEDARIYYDGTNLVINPRSQGTGGVEMLGKLTIQQPSLPLRIQNTDVGAGNPFSLPVAEFSAGVPLEGANNDEGYISYFLDESGMSPGNVEFARLTWAGLDVDKTSKDGRFEFAVMKANTLTDVLLLGALTTTLTADAISLTGPVTASSTLGVTGATTLSSTLGVTGNVGFYGTAPVAQAAAYTPTNVTTDRSYNADATTIDELSDVVGTLISDLQSYGLLA